MLVSEGVGSIFKRKDGKYFVYLPMRLVKDTAFPFKITETIKVKVRFRPNQKRIVFEGI
ncbi:MAG: hypothetical protein NWF08_06270 [Candidatus Bathyarchaeota archaeon]|nr:hypothetical protein [Candidatus Bathyarchaeota archaeon]